MANKMAKQNRFDCAAFSPGEIRTLSSVQAFANYIAASSA